MDDQPIESFNSGPQKRGLVAPLDLPRSLAALGRLERGFPASLPLTAGLASLSSNRQLTELATTLRYIQESMPKIDAAFAATFPPALPKNIAEVLAASERITSQIPRLAPEFIETLTRLGTMTSRIAVSPNVLALYGQINANHRLLDAARAATLTNTGQALRDYLLGDQWPVMHSFRYQGEEALAADIDLAEIEDAPAGSSSGLFLEESHRVKRIITDIYRDSSTLLRLGSRAFEEVIAELLRSQGFTVELTKQTRDGGYDLIALSHSRGGFPLKFLVECKRFTNKKIGIDIVRNLMYVVQQEQANKGIIAATTFFTRDAQEHRQSIHPYQLDLRDKCDVLEWIRRYGEDHLRLRNSNA